MSHKKTELIWSYNNWNCYFLWYFEKCINSTFDAAILGPILFFFQILLCFVGVTAFPGDGGQVYGIRNQRIYRQFTPKKEWFEYEDQSFDYQPIDKGMPWDPEVARKMDSFVDKRFTSKRLKTKAT